MDAIQVLRTAEERRAFWLKLAHKWKTIHWVAGTLGVLFSSLGALSTITIAGVNYTVPNKLFSAIAAVVVGFIGFASPLKQFYKNINAYITIDKAVRRFKEADVEALNKAIDDAEGIANPKE